MIYVDRLAELSDHGVSIGLDSLSRGWHRGGGLAALVRDRHVVRVTTDPRIFVRALADSVQYDRHTMVSGWEASRRRKPPVR
jgi:transaldolase